MGFVRQGVPRHGAICRTIFHPGCRRANVPSVDFIRRFPNAVKVTDMQLPSAEETAPDWRKASYCASGECIEVAFDGSDGAILVRDSKRPGGGNLAFSSAQWRSLLHGIRSGRYNHLSR